MRRFTQPGKRIASFTRSFARLRWALNFDGVGVRGQLANRAINPDGDIDIEWVKSGINDTGLIVSQNISSTASAREMHLSQNISDLNFIIGGNVYSPNVTSILVGGKLPTGKYRLLHVGSTLQIYFNGILVVSSSATRGAAREPTAVTLVGVRANGSVGSYLGYYTGVQRDVKINGVRWPMADRNQAIQLPQPSGLGDELITQSVLENPVEVGNQWSYLGSGRWSYVGDGSLNTLKFILTANQPAQGFFEFEIESISGGGITCTDTVPSNSVFTTIGVKRFFYTNKADITSIAFKRAPAGTSVSCIIKNISFKSLGACNPMTISNAASTNWVQVVDDYVAKFRKVLRFDGVGARGALANRAIDPDGDIDIEFYSPDTFGATKVIVSQNVTSTNTAKEFQLEVSATGAVIIRLGGAAQNMGTILPATKYRISLVGTLLVLYSKDGTVVSSLTFSRGVTREPTAVTVVGASTNGVANSYNLHFTGIQRDLKINGTLWPISDANQTIQLPEPSGLGVELLDNSSFLEPNGYVNTIVTTGLNSFKVLAPTSGATRTAKAFNLPNASDTVILEFDFVSKDPDALLSVFIRDGVVVGGGTVTWSTNLSSLGKQRFIIKNSSITLKNILFAVNVPCTFEIRNISIKPLGTCNPITLTNVTSANWEDLEI